MERYKYIRWLWTKGLETDARKEEELLTKELSGPITMLNEGLISATEFVEKVMEQATKPVQTH